MGSPMLVLVFLLCHVVLFTTKTEARAWYNISQEEDMKIEKQLQILNKPAVKSILVIIKQLFFYIKGDSDLRQGARLYLESGRLYIPKIRFRSKSGDLYDCVNFYDQPAFDHPLLKDHKYDYKIDMRPTLLSVNTSSNGLDMKRKSVNFRLKDGGCPSGTVPIRRITKEDLIREKHMSSMRRRLVDDDNPGSHYAVIRTKPSGDKYNGAGGDITAHNPQCTGMQYSAARVKVQNGPDSIEAGWRVDPALYGDTKTRLFIRLDAGQSHCFNTRCPGFIIVRSDLPLDQEYPEVSIPGGHYLYLSVFLNRDLVNGDWWFQVGLDLLNVGFWPQRIFTGLSDWATSAEWGGEVFSPPGTIKPPMGVGHSIYRDTRVDAYIFQCNLLDGKRTLPANNVKIFHDTENYEVADLGFWHGENGHVVIYGGPASK